jgi:probable H4MPT-linked C1 transfer pathway protein
LTDSDDGPCLALDIGGANVKLAHATGGVRSRPFALWREPDALPRVLAEAADGLPPFRRVLLTMTAELCDCFPTKRLGVLAVLDAVSAAFPGRPVSVWGLDGRFHEPGDVRDRPEIAAASNWLALATAAAGLAGVGPALLIDIGSTTTDLIPLDGGRVVATATDDTGRLRSGELVYAGVRRTPLCALAASLPFRGRATRLCAELFATTLDVYLTLGALAEDRSDTTTADGRPATVGAALDRLARMVGADRDGFSPADALALSRSADEVLLLRLTEAVLEACRPLGGRPDAVIAGGSGEFLAERLARRVVSPGGRVIGLGELWGPDASAAACARALLILADPDGNRPGTPDAGRTRGALS